MRVSVNQAAAKWWADLLREPPVHNSGSEKLDNAFNKYAVNPTPLTENEIQKFQNVLAVALDAPEVKMLIGDDEGLWIEVDYHPSMVLKAAAKYVGFNLDGRLPIKTRMRIAKNRIEVCKEYGSPWEVIYKI